MRHLHLKKAFQAFSVMGVLCLASCSKEAAQQSASQSPSEGYADITFNIREGG